MSSAIDRRRVGLAAVTLALALGLAGCGDGSPAGGGETDGTPPAEAPAVPLEDSLSPTGRPDILAMLREDLEAPRSESDGAGKAWIDWDASGPRPVAPGGVGRWSVIYEAGDPGVSEGGWLFLQPSPFWGWSPPQVNDPAIPGFTAVETDAEGVELEPRVVDQGLLGIEVGGRGLVAGEQVRMTYGAGEVGAYADVYAEREARLWVAVDGDGDGVRRVVESSPRIEVVAGPAAMLSLIGPSTGAAGEVATYVVAALDARGNTGVVTDAVLALDVEGPAAAAPESVSLASTEGGVARVEVVPSAPGVYRLRARGAGLEATSNPLVVGGGHSIVWGDLHGHSGLSDGTGTPEDYFRYARDVARLDVVALTDHDHWAVQPLALTPGMWEGIVEQVAAFHDPGSFVTILGYEWTNWVHGHRHVLYFTAEGEVLSSVDPDYETPRQLWDALEGRDALTFAHHSAGGPVATNWEYEPDPVLEPVTEVVSVHGSSEAGDSPGLIYSAAPGNFVRDVLDRGYRLGFVGSGDSHDGHPGLSQINAATGGLAAIFTEELTRDSVLVALRERRAYATSGPRIVLGVTLAGHPMGAIAAAAGFPDPAPLEVDVVGTAAVDRIELVRSGEIVAAFAGDGRSELTLQVEVPELASGEYVYVRVVQVDGGVAWSSPIWVDE